MAKKISRLQKFRTAIESLLDESMFRSQGEPTRFYKFLHFWVLVGKSFVRNRCPLRASALSYTTLLALIPMLAVAMSVTTSLLKKEGKQQIEHFIETFVSKIVPPAGETNPPPPSGDTNAALETGTNLTAGVSSNAPTVETLLTDTNLNLSLTTMTNAAPPAGLGTDEDVSDKSESRLTTAQKNVADKIYSFVQQAQSGAIAGVGMLLLIYAAIRMLSQVEGTFNDIWGVTRGRNWWTSIILYWAAITLGPLLLAGVFGLASGPHLKSTQAFLMKMPGIGALLFKWLPVFLLWIAFALFYKAVPNTKVHWNAAFVGGLVGGTAWHVNNMLGFLYVSRVVTYSKMYGGLGLVPVFMLGLYLSWLLLLFGSQVAYAFQNRALYLQEKLAENVNQRGREFVALRLMTCVSQRFHRGLPPATIQEMSSELGIPSRLVQQVLQTLLAARLVVEISGLEPAYSPARPLENINAHHVLMAMRALQGQELITRDEPVREEVYGEFARIQEAEKQVASVVSMLALVNRAEARLQIVPPPSPHDEIKLKPALVPPKPNAGAKTKPTESAANEFTESPSNESKPVKTQPGISEAPSKRSIGPANDEEREFPL